MRLWLIADDDGTHIITDSDGQQLTENLLAISLTDHLVTEVVKLNKNSLVNTVV